MEWEGSHLIFVWPCLVKVDALRMTQRMRCRDQDQQKNGPSEVIEVELSLVTSWYVSIKGYIIRDFQTNLSSSCKRTGLHDSARPPGLYSVIKLLPG